MCLACFPRMRLGSVLFAVLALGIGVCCGNALARGCIRVPQTIPENRLVTSGTKLIVPVGAIVYDVLVEPDEYSSGPGFPWVTPTSSDRSVLAQVRLCKSTAASSLALTVTGFRAEKRGAARLTAVLAPRWRSVKRKPQPSLVRVTVR
jgi:hypothetical protein